MSIKMIPGAARLTVLGSGWSNSSVESGDGQTEDGKLWEDIAGDLGYDYGSNVDWDQIAGDGIDWSDTIYTDQDGNIYTDPDGTGIWTDSEGNEYEGDGSLCLTADQTAGVSDSLSDVAENDAQYTQYGIDRSALKKLWGGPVSVEKTVIETGADRPHAFYPPVFYIQTNSTNATLFQSEAFVHVNADGSNISVSSDYITIRNGSRKAVFWSDCTTRFWENYLPAPYSGYPIQYVCWQCLHGSFFDVLVSAKEGTITTDMILSGESGLEQMEYDGKTYYKVGG